MHSEFEDYLKEQGYKIIIGIDEAGRGPLAGPVVASAVSIHNSTFDQRIADSKKLSPKRREQAFEEIFNNAYVGVGIIRESVIDECNILQATYMAMNTAVEKLIDKLPDLLTSQENFHKSVCMLIDGDRFKSTVPYRYQTVVKGDSKVLSIACASIVAKVTRDRIIDEYDEIYPQYGFSKHKGYPTKQHKQAIKEHGLLPIHRKTFNSSF